MTAADATRKATGLPLQWAVVAAICPKKSDHVFVLWFCFLFALTDRPSFFAAVLLTESGAAAARTFIFVFRPIALPACLFARMLRRAVARIHQCGATGRVPA